VESCSALAEDAHGRIRVLQAVPDRPKLVSLTPRVVGLAPRRERAAAAPAAKEVQTAA
jgi:hypothetical protein